MSALKQGITIAGSLIADVFYEIDTYPSAGLLTTVRNTSLNIGGTGNIIIDLAKLDPSLKVKVCAIVGDDKEGKHLLKRLDEFSNVDTENITVTETSAITLVMNAQDTKQRTFFVVPGANDEFNESYINWDKINTKIFHLEYLLLMKQVDAFDEEYGTHGARILHDAQERGMITSIDAVSEQSDRAARIVSAALKYTDVCCINEFEAYSLTGVELVKNDEIIPESALLALKKMKEAGVGKWVVIHSPKVSYGYDCENDEFVCVPSLDLPNGYIKGSTGAGDAYCSGILYGVYKDMSLLESMRLARSTAACSLSENNGTDGMRSFEDAMKLEKIYPEKII